MAVSSDYQIALTRMTHGFDRQTCWVQARGGVIPGSRPIAVVTMQKLQLAGCDVFSGLYETRSHDGGETWSAIEEIPALRRWRETGGVEAAICDATPQWHAATGKLLLTGQVARYVGDELMPEPRPRHTAYSVYDASIGQWGQPRLLEMPDANRYFSSGAGSAQRLDLPGGDILLPIYTSPLQPQRRQFESAIARCRFDGHTLAVVAMGSHHSVEIGRGLYEPSVATFGGRYFVTLRNDEAGYVMASDDGLHYDEPVLWRFDDGQVLENYNTQQHWVTRPDGLFLVYTRRGLNNDHVFRHRAPLVMAQVDPQTLTLRKDTERVIVPERGARLGNFSVMDFNEHETWVVAAEWMQNTGMHLNPDICTQYGSDNSVWVSRLRWPAR